jgi:SAM-dependent methyltransferase
MRDAGWRCVALDPDPRVIAFTSADLGLETVCGDFMTTSGIGPFSLITFNKVLEHVADPVTMLAHAREMVTPGGALYIEVPDAEGAARDPEGANREEFFIEHLQVFSLDSLVRLIGRAGFEAQSAVRIREPSGKYTLYAFATLMGGDAG